MKRLLNSIEDGLTVRQQIAFGTAILCLVLVGSLAGAAAYMSRQQATSLVSSEMRTLAISISNRLDVAIYHRLRELQFLADAEPMLARWRSSDPAAVRRMLDQMQAAQPDLVWGGLARPDGMLKAATSGQPQSLSVADQEWFKQGMKGMFVQDVHDEKPVEGEVEESPTATPFRIVKIGLPVRDRSGLLVGVLGLQLNEEWTSEIRNSFREMSGLDAGSTTIWVLSRDGSILSGGAAGSHPYSPERIKEMVAERQGSFVDELLPGPALAGFAVAHGMRDLPGLDWIVVARRPVEVAAQSWRSFVNGILVLGAALAVTGIFMATYLAGRVARPIRGLTSEADQIGRDPAAFMIGRHSGSREVVDLSSSLRSLMRRVGFAEEQRLMIEQRAAEESRKLNQDVDILRSLAEVDPMTGLLNRRAFSGASAQATTDFHDRHIPFAVLILDIDHFKRVNDTFGHVAGDQVLRAVAHVLQGLVRASDLVARYGGEEFVVLLREMQRENVRMIAETMRGAVAAMRVAVDGRDITVTISIGAAVAAARDRDFEDVFRRADLALYTAKRGGRNQVQEASPDQDGALLAAE